MVGIEQRIVKVEKDGVHANTLTLKLVWELEMRGFIKKNCIPWSVRSEHLI
jgi:nitrogen fixation protein